MRPQTVVREQMKAWLVEVPSTPSTHHPLTPTAPIIHGAPNSHTAGSATQNMVAPNELEINPPSFQPKRDLTEDDVQKAIKAVSLARTYSALHEGPV